MNEKLKSLALILERMNTLYGRVIESLAREREALVRLDYERLYQEIRDKDEALSAIRALDRDRLRIQDQFAVLMGKNSSEVTLYTLGMLLVEQGPPSEADGKRLLDLRDRLGQTVERLRERVLSNRDLIERSISNLHAVAEQVSAALGARPAKRAATYGKQGTIVEDQGAKSGSLVQERF